MARGNDEKNNPRRKVSRADLVMRDLQAIIEGRMAAPKSITQLGLDDTESDVVDITDDEAMGRIAKKQKPYLDKLGKYLGGDPSDIAESVSEEDEYK